jgi:predicted ArsR family transcriptional regulator
MYPGSLRPFMPREQHPDSGRFTEVYADGDVLAALAELEEAGTSDVAEELGCSRRYAYERLRGLEEEGRIDSRTIGRTRIWTLAEGVSQP